QVKVEIGRLGSDGAVDGATWTDSLVLGAFTREQQLTFRVLAMQDPENPLSRVTLRYGEHFRGDRLLAQTIGTAGEALLGDSSMAWIGFEDRTAGLQDIGGFWATLADPRGESEIVFPVTVERADGSRTDWAPAILVRRARPGPLWPWAATLSIVGIVGAIWFVRRRAG
ncbi:MAG: hypothetical protein R3246_15625, partial [Acidimicrobiia bacterium]|nr:hypothetical protein [Acidimicrobiia bacterium]